MVQQGPIVSKPLFKKGGGGGEVKEKKRKELKSHFHVEKYKGGGLHFVFTKCILYQGRKILACKIQQKII